LIENGMPLRRLLFVCARNQLRSPTAEAVFGLVDGLEVSSAGTAPDAECVVSTDLIEWADELFVMEKQQRDIVQKRFGRALDGKRVVCLNIRDRYAFMQTELIEVLRAKMRPYL
jgi:predicted protein tyrosine phosphatase